MKKLLYGTLAIGVFVMLFFFNPKEETRILSTIEFDTADTSVVFMHSPEALIGKLSEKSPDAIVISAFDYIHYFEKLRDYKALFSMPYNTSLWENSNTSSETIQVMASLSLMDDYLISETLPQPYTITRQTNLASAQRLFFESYVSHLVSIAKPPVDGDEKAVMLNDLDALDMGFALILIRVKDPAAIDERIDWITESFSQVALSLPEESQLQEAIHWLFVEKYIKTRYYYDDLVFLNK